jgi:hypothetical protein
MLSNRGELILWEDIQDYKLVQPFLRGFKDIVTYAFIALAFSSTSYILKTNILVTIYFVFGISLLIIITYKMIGVYYDKDAIEKRIVEEFYNQYKKGNKNACIVCLEKMHQNNIILLKNGENSRLSSNISFLIDFIINCNEKSKDKSMVNHGLEIMSVLPIIGGTSSIIQGVMSSIENKLKVRFEKDVCVRKSYEVLWKIISMIALENPILLSEVFSTTDGVQILISTQNIGKLELVTIIDETIENINSMNTYNYLVESLEDIIFSEKVISSIQSDLIVKSLIKRIEYYNLKNNNKRANELKNIQSKCILN